jgi:hypothetical protein
MMMHSWIWSNEEEINMQDNELQAYINCSSSNITKLFSDCKYRRYAVWIELRCVGKDSEDMVMTTNSEQVKLGTRQPISMYYFTTCLVRLNKIIKKSLVKIQSSS